MDDPKDKVGDVIGLLVALFFIVCLTLILARLTLGFYRWLEF